MPTTLEATYTRGQLKLDHQLMLDDGARVWVTIDSTLVQESSELPRRHRRRAFELLAEVAALPLEGEGEPFSGEDHDLVLYGSPRGAY